MKALRLFALLLILAAVVGNASARSSLGDLGPICGGSTDPTLCDQITGDDTGCSSFCDEVCSGYANVSGNCIAKLGGGFRCRCTGQIIP